MKKIKRLGKHNTTTVRIRFLDSSIYGIKVKALLRLIGFLFLCFSFITLLILLFPGRFNQHNHSETKSNNPAIEAKVFEIASMFICSCKKCVEETLEACKCNRAIEERNLIRKDVEQKESTKNIVLKIAERYGYLKIKYANNYNVAKSQIWSNSN